MIKNYHINDFSNNKPSTLVFILHGYGANGKNLLDLSNFFASSVENPLFIAPDAPFPFEYDFENGRQWFSLMDRDENVLLSGAKKAYDIFLEFVNFFLEKYNLTYSNVILIGFSQGTMMSLYTGLKFKTDCKGILGFSGTIVSAEETITSFVSKPKICLIHGSDDDVVPCSLGKYSAKILKNMDIDATFHEITNLDHSINEEGIVLAQNFLKNL